MKCTESETWLNISPLSAAHPEGEMRPNISDAPVNSPCTLPRTTHLTAWNSPSDERLNSSLGCWSI